MRDLTTGPIRGHILQMTGFILVSMVVYTLYAVVDLYWVSRLGTQAIAAVSISANLMMLTMAATQVLDVGTTAVVSHAAGRKDHAEVQLRFNQSLAMAIVGAVLIAVAFFAVRFTYLSAFAADAETVRLGGEFLFWFIPAMALQFVLVSFCAGLRGTGTMRPAMFAQIGSVVLNLILSPILIFGWLTGYPLGVAGAGLATFLSVAAGIAGLALHFRREASYLHCIPSLWRPRLDLWRQILKIGLPAGAELALMLIYLLVIYGIIRVFGSGAQAGFGLGMRIMTVGALPAMAISFAIAAVAGQNFGAERNDRVRESFRVGALYVSIWTILVTGLFQIAPEVLVRIFSPDVKVVAVGRDFLAIISLSLLASGLIATCSGLFQALGNTLPMLFTSAVRILFVIAMAYWLGTRPGFQLWQLWLMSAATVYLQLGLCLWLIRREFRRRLAV